eukprot:TRINITY_DN23985_c0_g1_i2.p1 TRINITY_DN23985_c0_g1~~TRINITY_DN23985_c0_g1_i2.p1  ORF type:complete len:205 (-),score=34.34 TRINITY_DN23985_c0_g1_i2:12-626(-)
MVLRGPCRKSQAPRVRDVCFAHDPRHDQVCANGESCPKEHLRTSEDSEAAERFDEAVRAWKAALARKAEKRGRKQCLSEQCAGYNESGKALPPCAAAAGGLLEMYKVVVCDDLPVPSGVHDAPWYYDEKWYHKAAAASFISVASYLANTALWACIPRLRRYCELLPEQRESFADTLGRCLGQLLNDQEEPRILCVEKPYYDDDH